MVLHIFPFSLYAPMYFASYSGAISDFLLTFVAGTLLSLLLTQILKLLSYIPFGILLHDLTSAFPVFAQAILL